MPEVSVVIPTLNQLAHLQAAIASVLRQGGIAVEVLVAEDGGDDGTAAWLAGLDDPRVRALEPAGHHGAAWQCNRALATARGELVMFLDHDDELLDGALAKLTEALRREPGAVAAVGARTRLGRRMSHPSRPVVRRVETGRAALAAFARTAAISPRLAYSPLVWPSLAHGARDAARLIRSRGT